MPENLGKFFLRPWSSTLVTQVVQNEQGSAPNLFKHLVVSDIAVWGECGP